MPFVLCKNRTCSPAQWGQFNPEKNRVRSTVTKVKTHGAVTAVNGNKRGEIELTGYLKILCWTSDSGTTGGALRRGTGTGMESSFTQATRTRTSMRRRLARLPSTGSFIGIIGVIWTSCRSSPAPPGGLDPLRVAALAVSTRAPGDDRLLGDLG